LLQKEGFGVDTKRIWDVVKEDLPDLKKKIKMILKKMEEK